MKLIGMIQKNIERQRETEKKAIHVKDHVCNGRIRHGCEARSQGKNLSRAVM
jgi:hypothetical protein